jgi:hypothetical protein
MKNASRWALGSDKMATCAVTYVWEDYRWEIQMGKTLCGSVLRAPVHIYDLTKYITPIHAEYPLSLLT